ncbi:MAG: response regulator [Sedimentisphaerales bacterium]|nr:response regulator [Sedimentisphaerales bacterium]
MGQKKILIIDDDPDITEAVKVILEKQGYAADIAEDGSKGMERVKANKPDLIILDVMMNTLSEGFLVSRELKKDPKYKQIPILMVTSVKEKTGIDFETAAGDETWLPVEGYLNKPVKPEVLLDKVRTLLHEQ